MQFKRYNNINEFYDDTYELLMCHEAQNLIPLGNLVIGKKGDDISEWRNPINWFMAPVSDDTAIQLVAIMTPPHSLTLYARDNKVDDTAVICLVNNIADISVPSVMAKKDMALHFARAYCLEKSMSYKVHQEQRIYELAEVNPDISHIGIIRSAIERDMYFLPYWLEAFYSDATEYGRTTMNIPQDAKTYLSRVVQQKLYVLEVNGTPVSIAGITREMQNVCGIAQVYTPPYFRRKGYATSCVAALSQIILERGFKKCVLYTDMANSTSNIIYQKIGYRPICDSVVLNFI